jgi:5'-methylthioadenosine phosphorylase
MTNIPEVFLAREAQLCYATVGVITDYDSWKDQPEEHATASSIVQAYSAAMGRVKTMLHHYISSWRSVGRGVSRVGCSCRSALDDALLMPGDRMPHDKRELFEFLRR